MSETNANQNLEVLEADSTDKVVVNQSEADNNKTSTPQDEKKPKKEKEPSVAGTFLKNLPSAILSTGIVSLFWIVLNWLSYSGIRWAILAPLNYLTGATIGQYEGTIFGSAIARTILILFLNGFIVTFINHKGSIKSKIKTALRHYKNSLLNLIPFFNNITKFSFRDKVLFPTNIMGIGIGFLIFGLLTGDASAQNSFVMLIVFVAVANEIANKRGIIIALLNLVFSFFGRKRISRKPADGVVNGIALGSLLSIIYSLMTYTYVQEVYRIGFTILAVGTALYIFNTIMTKKELKKWQEEK